MKVQYLPKIDWEPLCLQIGCTAPPDLKELRGHVAEWLARRDRNPLCETGCKTKFMAVVPGRNPEDVLVLAQWMCRQCVEHLLQSLEKTFAQVVKIRVGESRRRSDELLPRGGWLSIADQEVLLESGDLVHVQACVISRQPVSVSDMDTFCSQTRYRTVAEREGYPDTFRSNGLLSGIEEHQLGYAPAWYLCVEDAREYCNWAHTRLPSEAELLAGMCIDSVVRPQTERDQVAARACILQWAGLSMSASQEGQRVVARNGPYVSRVKGWEQQSRVNRVLIAEHDCVCQFYVVQ